MEDFFCIEPEFHDLLGERSKKLLDTSSGVFYCGVFDGHNGTRAAKTCTERLHHRIASELEKSENVTVTEAIFTAFQVTDEEILSGTCVDSSGSTAISVVISDRLLHVAHTGDSRVVLSRAGVAIPVTQDHKPSVSEEKVRIESNGGVITDNRLNGLLGVSRAFGGYDPETNAKIKGLSSIPDAVSVL